VFFDKNYTFLGIFSKKTEKINYLFTFPLPHESTTDQGKPIFLLKSGDFLVDFCFFLVPGDMAIL